MEQPDLHLEEELPPGRPPVVAAGDDRPRVDDLDALAVAELRHRPGPLELDLDLARLPRVVRRDCLQLRERLLRAGLNEFAGALRLEHARAEDEDAFGDGARRDAVSEQPVSLP